MRSQLIGRFNSPQKKGSALATATFERRLSLSALAPTFGSAERVFWRGVTLMMFFISAFFLVQLVEKNALNLRSKQRFVVDSIEAPMRYFTLAHITVATLFMVSATKNRTAQRRWLLAGLTGAGGLLCLAFYAFTHSFTFWEPRHNPLFVYQIQMLVYAYFLIHEMRDELFFYRNLGDCPRDEEPVRFAKLTNGLITFGVLLLLLGEVWPGILLKRDELGDLVVMQELSGPARAFAIFIPLAAWVIGLYAFLDLSAKRYRISLGELLCRHAPLFRVFSAVLATIFVGVLLFQRPYLLILLHVCVWYVFACYSFARQPRKTHAPGWWAWMRTTLPGFKFLHLSLFALFLVAGLVCVYVFKQEGWIWTLMGPQAMVYWTITHITVSFMPR